MRSARRVIVLLLILSAAGCLHAQESAAPSESSVDADVTILGRDDAIIPIPEPENIDDEPVLPSLDPDQADSFLVPPVLPPVVDVTAQPPDTAAP